MSEVSLDHLKETGRYATVVRRKRDVPGDLIVVLLERCRDRRRGTRVFLMNDLPLGTALFVHRLKERAKSKDMLFVNILLQWEKVSKGDQTSSPSPFAQG